LGFREHQRRARLLAGLDREKRGDGLRDQLAALLIFYHHHLAPGLKCRV